MDITEVRQKYPQYSDLSDEQLMRGLHAKHYSDIPYEQFASRITGQQATAAASPFDRLPRSAQGKGIEGVKGTNVEAALFDFAKAFDMSVARMVDFLGPGQINSLLEMAGSDKRVPTAAEFVESLDNPGRPTLPEGVGKAVVEGAGTLLPSAASAYQVVGRNLASAPGAIAEFAGLGSKAPLAPAAQASEAASTKLALLNQTGDVSTAGKMLKPNMPVDQQIVIADKAGKKALKHGYSDAMVAYVKSATPEAKQQMLKMVKILKGGQQNLRNRTVRPWDVVGESIMGRYNAVLAKNKEAGSRLKGVANTLRDKFDADPEPAMRQLYKELDEMGIKAKVNPKTGKLVPEFMDSDLMDSDGQEIIKRLFNRLQISKRPDGRDMHSLKRSIDEWVDYGGPGGTGLKGEAETIVKRFRHNIDKALDEAYPEYNEVNTIYADTVDALNQLRDVAGAKTDLGKESAKSVMGKISGRLANKAVSGDRLSDAIASLDDVSKKYNLLQFDDEIREQVEFINELERVVRPGLSGDFTSKIGASLARDAAATAKADTSHFLSKGFDWVVNKATGVNEKEALDAMEELLKR